MFLLKISFYKRIIASATTGYVTIGTDTIQQEKLPLYKYYDYSWSKYCLNHRN